MNDKRIKLSIRNLTKKYTNDSSDPALDNICFDVYDGEFLSILGPSGCGKTTLLRIMMGLVKPTQGMVTLEGVDITNNHPSARSMGIVFQNYALFENMTALENVVYAAHLKAKREKSATKQELKKRAKELLETLGVADQADHYPQELSGGQQQRIAIARTLMHNPQIMLFDEPMSALDIATRLQLRELLKKIQQDFGTTMVYITHDQEEAFAMSDRILVMDNAKIVQLDTPYNIIASPANDYVREFVVDNLRKKTASLIKYFDKTHF